MGLPILDTSSYEKNLQRGDFCVCLLSLSVFSMFIQGVACGTSFLSYGQIISHHKDIPHLFILSSVDEHLSCFQFGAL